MYFPPNHPRYTSGISRMGGRDGNIRGFRKLRICSHLVLGPFWRPLPGRWGQGRGGPESGDLDTLSYPSRGRDFNLNLVHDVLIGQIAFRDAKRPTETKNVCLCYHETRPSGEEQGSQWHGQLHCLAQKT